MDGYTVYPFPFGQLLVKYQDGAVTRLTRTEEPVREEGRTALTDLVFQQISEYLEGRRRTFDFPYVLKGTPFQQRVWQALCTIPYGETRTYGEIAAAVGSPKAFRAVGMANHQKQSIIYGVYVVDNGTGRKLVVYGGDLDMKESLFHMDRWVLE